MAPSPARSGIHAAAQHEVPDHDAWLTEPEAQRLNAMRFAKRRDESRMGRWTAKHAVARSLELDLDPRVLRDVVIKNASDGAPEVFFGTERAPVAISMTDRAGWAVCMVSSGAASIGCDLELIEPRSELFVADYFTPAERAIVAAAPHRHDLLANLIWSAKESALKVLREGLRLDTRSVEVTLGEPHGDGWQALTVQSSAGDAFPGWWTSFGQFLLTFCATEPHGSPAPMGPVSPLADAVPTHTWMDAPLRYAPDQAWESRSS